jgi:catechol 2,3-dioxygenase-like lactoylglutathione lyase family enzyme
MVSSEQSILGAPFSALSSDGCRAGGGLLHRSSRLPIGTSATARVGECVARRFQAAAQRAGRIGLSPLPGGESQRPGGWNRVVLRVANLAAQIDALENAGVKFRNQIAVGPVGRQIQVDDPDGNPIELFEPAMQESHT